MRVEGSGFRVQGLGFGVCGNLSFLTKVLLVYGVQEGGEGGGRSPHWAPGFRMLFVILVALDMYNVKPYIPVLCAPSPIITTRSCTQCSSVLSGALHQASLSQCRGKVSLCHEDEAKGQRRLIME